MKFKDFTSIVKLNLNKKTIDIMSRSDYFISHSSKDKDIAFRIVEAIESTGHTCWIAPRNIPYGTPYARAIMEGIDECSTFIVLITDNSIKSENVLNEVDNAHASNKKIIPVRLTGTMLPRELNFYLSRTQWMTLPSNSPETIIRLLDLREDTVGPDREITKTYPSEEKKNFKIQLLIFAALAVVFCVGGIFIWRLAIGKSEDIKEETTFIENTNSDMIVAQKDTVYIEKTIVPVPDNKTESTKTAEKEKNSPIVNENQTSSNTPNYKDMISNADSYYRQHFYNNAFPLYEDIAQHYDINYAHKVGWMYQYGEGIDKDADKAIEWYKKAADNGNAEAQINLASLYMTLERYKEAVKYYLIADKQGKLNSEGKYWLGHLYYEAKGVDRNRSKAKEYWQQAASEGIEQAKTDLDKFFYSD